MEEKTYTFFWGLKNPNAFMSQFYSCTFTIDDINFTSAEQYMMYCKAILFEDDESAQNILATKNPRTIKKLGRKVKNFNNEIWIDEREGIVFQGNWEKFSQNESLKNSLLKTDTSILAEASPFDKIYGIGLRYTHKHASDPTKWPGLNLLGTILMEVRTKLQESS